MQSVYQGAGAKSQAGGSATRGSVYNPNNNVYRSHSVDSQMTSLSGGSDLTTASQHVSEDGIENAIKIRRDPNAPIEVQAGLAAPTVGLKSRKGHNNLHGGSSATTSAPIGGTGQVPVCTLCDSAPSDFSCRACGGLTFCEKCALSLHTNKFLGSHQLENILDPNDKVQGSDLAIRRAQMDAERAAREVYSDEARAARMRAEEETLQQTLRIAESAGREKAKEEEEQRHLRELRELREGPRLDMKALASDRSVINARGKELRSCIDILRRLSLRLAEEQASCIDATRTAGDAIRKKFDLLRNLINQKEAQFLGVVQDAGKTRHEAAASQRTAVAAAVAETTAFVDNLELQMQRLEGNYVMFDESRGGLLEDTRLKIAHVDGLIHKFEGIVQEVREIPLGVVVPLDGIVTALQMLHAPERTIGSSEVAMLNAAEALLAVPADSFENALGVKHFRSGGSAEDYYNNTAKSTNSPLRRNASSANNNNSSRPAPFEIREVQQQRASSPFKSGNNNSNNSNNGVASSRHAGTGMPPEVRELRKHLQLNANLLSNNSGNGSRPQSPTSQRTSSPLVVAARRTGSPMRTANNNNNNTGSSSFLNSNNNNNRVSGTNNNNGYPGPGSYYVPYPLNNRNGPLSTPPRGGTPTRR